MNFEFSFECYAYTQINRLLTILITYNHILASFESFQNFLFFDKSCILNAFGWYSVTERLTLVYYKFCNYWIKVSFSGNQAWRSINEAFKKFQSLKNDDLIEYILKVFLIYLKLKYFTLCRLYIGQIKKWMNLFSN